MDSTTQTTDGNIKLNSDLFDLAEKLRIELQKKDQELADKNEEITELSDNLDLAMSRASQVDELQQTIHALQMSLWKCFPHPDRFYYIKTQSGSQNGQFRYLYVEANTFYLRSSVAQTRSECKFTKNSDDTFSISICSVSMGNTYLQTNTNSSRLTFTNGIAGKFVLFFHPQNQQAGLLVDISSTAGYFLCVDNNNHVVANSRTQPANKFQIVPVGVE